MKTKCPECGHRYSGYHSSAACLLYKNTRKPNKYHAERTEVAGRSFASRLEAEVYQILLLRMKGGEFVSVECQSQTWLSPARIGYKSDFKCTSQDGTVMWVEAKGVEGERWRIVKKLWTEFGMGPLEIWKQGRRGPQLVEMVQPKQKEEIQE